MKVTTKMIDEVVNVGDCRIDTHKNECDVCKKPGKNYFMDARGMSSYRTIIVNLCKRKKCNGYFHYKNLIKLSEKDIFYIKLTKNE